VDSDVAVPAAAPAVAAVALEAGCSALVAAAVVAAAAVAEAADIVAEEEVVVVVAGIAAAVAAAEEEEAERGRDIVDAAAAAAAAAEDGTAVDDVAVVGIAEAPVVAVVVAVAEAEEGEHSAAAAAGVDRTGAGTECAAGWRLPSVPSSCRCRSVPKRLIASAAAAALVELPPVVHAAAQFAFSTQARSAAFVVCLFLVCVFLC
jgi:hypothetical protein